MQREKLLRRHSACAMRSAGEEEESGQPARKHRVTVDFSLLTIPPLPEDTLPAAPSLPPQEALSSSGSDEVGGPGDTSALQFCH